MDTPFQLETSRGFLSWLVDQRASLAFTTYTTGKLFLLGVNQSGQSSIVERTFPRAMACWSNGQTMWLSTLYQLWRLENVLPEGQTFQDCDAVFVPRQSYVTGDIDIHDVSLNEQGHPLFVSSLFSCLATVSELHNFKPIWKPDFISKLAAEDRCHFNGMALREGRPQYATVCNRSDAADGWRSDRSGNGCVLDIPSSQPVCTDLCMPHAPRWYDNRLWLHDSGSGRFGFVDLKANRFEEVAFCPGYLRGLSFAGRYAVVTISSLRNTSVIGDLPLVKELEKRRTDARCGILVIDIDRGEVLHWLRIFGPVTELFDVTTLPGTTKPWLLGTQSNEICHMLSIDPGHEL